MEYILVPQVVTTTTAMIWVGAVAKDVRRREVKLVYIEKDKYVSDAELLKDLSRDKKDRIGVVIDLRESEWRTWKTRHGLDRRLIRTLENKFFHYQRVTVGFGTPMTPRTRYEIRLAVDGEFTKNCEAQLTTLPVELPGENEKTFKVLLGSCFYGPNDEYGMVGKTFHKLSEKERPEITFLCGDQVYLDNPWRETSFNILRPFLPPERMRTYFFEKYIANWTQLGEYKDGSLCGFNLLLRNGANYFCSDDHEFWNNAPDFGMVGFFNTLFRGQRSWWFREAGELFRVFQSLSPWMTFDVPPVSFCIVDSRINRLPNRINILPSEIQFMETEDLDAVKHWIKNLKGPGVLVMGQLLLEEKKGLLGIVTDLNLADFNDQYSELVKAIKGSDHSIVFLTGDVHYGRVSECDLDKSKETKFVEVVSSPLMVVDNIWGKDKIGSVDKPPKVFGTKVKCYSIAEGQNHFVTLEFSKRADGKVKMKINVYPISKPGSKAAPKKQPELVEGAGEGDECIIPTEPIEIIL